ncbi:putative nucleotidyltransferase, Ribonuclease H [Helianthus annuus]|nr:putative nucleotidyltransferase, Ribonuclease H [Helianthus annuus]
MDEAHKSRYSVTPGSDKMYHDIKTTYWWPSMKAHIATYVSKWFDLCASPRQNIRNLQAYFSNQRYHNGNGSKFPWISLLAYLDHSGGNDTIWVIVDRLTKSAHFLAIKETDKFSTLAEIYLKEVVSRHGVPTSIISDRDAPRERYYLGDRGSTHKIRTLFGNQGDG